MIAENRHNVMNIYSMPDFANVRGGFAGSTRDVYFVRILGENQTFQKELTETERRLSEAAEAKRIVFRRVSSLAKLTDIRDAERYAAVYDHLKNGQNTGFRNIREIRGLRETIARAAEKTESLYQKHQSGITKSILRNRMTKILFWLDAEMGECFADWNERRCIKVIADNVRKEQEYVFYLFLTFLGCDVLLVQNRCDAEACSGLLAFSEKVVLGDFGSTNPVPYVKKKSSITEDRSSGEPPRKVEIPPRPQTRRRQIVPGAAPQTANRQIAPAAAPQTANRQIAPAAAPQTANRQSSPAAAPQTASRQSASLPSEKKGQSPRNDQAEKSYEEIALLASSIVLIIVHDRTGKVTATGSGIMIGERGYILTNYHVVKNGRMYSVRIEDDEEVYRTGEVIKYHPVNDLAVIRINRRLTPVPLYRGSKLVRGQRVVAIGSPLGLFNSVSDGIVSGFRNINDVNMIQFTAPISHGSSGGAVLNMNGELIGISTAGIDSGQNINLAVGYEDIAAFVGGFL